MVASRLEIRRPVTEQNDAFEPSQENDYDTYIWDNVGNFCDGALGKNTLVRSEVLRNASEIV